jgi:hypothetical protein
LKLGQARGIAMVVPALAGLRVAEYAPNAVKKAVIGVGHGEKAQIHMMVKVLLPKRVSTAATPPTLGHRHLPRASSAKCELQIGGGMIGKLKGVIDEIDEDHCIVDVHGVGYVAYCSVRTLAGRSSAGVAIELKHRDLCP